MLYTIPDYYHEFSCIAGECEDTCCARLADCGGRSSVEKYKKVTGSFRKRLRRPLTGKKEPLSRSRISAVPF